MKQRRNKEQRIKTQRRTKKQRRKKTKIKKQRRQGSGCLKKTQIRRNVANEILQPNQRKRMRKDKRKHRKVMRRNRTFGESPTAQKLQQKAKRSKERSN